MARSRLGGVIAPVLTPFGVDAAPDTLRFIAHCKWLMASGCTALAPFGTTSEANSLGLAERKLLLVALVAAGLDPSRLMPGTGMCALPDAVELTQHALSVGAGGVLMLPPFYYKAVKDDGLYRFFAETIERVGDSRLRVYLYHIPPVAQVGFSRELIARLVKAYPRTIVGLKDSSGDWAHTRGLIEAFPELEIYSGSELSLLDNLRAGGAGCISATCNVGATLLRRIYDDPTGAEAVAQQALAAALRKEIQGQPMIPMLKSLVAHYRDDPVWRNTRAPLEPLPVEIALPAIVRLRQEHGFELQIGSDA